MRGIPLHDEAVEGHYRGREAELYFAQKRSSDPFVHALIARRRAAKFQSLIQGDSVLEFGVGMGVNLAKLQVRRRVGYDIGEVGRLTCEAAGIGYTTDVCVLGIFDTIICHHVLEHVPDPLETLATMKALLVPGGRLILCVPFETRRVYRRYTPDDINRHLFSWNARTLGNLVTAAGYSIDSITVRPFGYEQRLAGLARVHDWLYSVGLLAVRLLLPEDELMVLARC